jgi:transcriptional regulator with XRE-family HTH domain
LIAPNGQHQKCKVMPVPITPAQCRAARGLLGWSQEQLAVKAKVAKATIANFELEKRKPYDRTLDDLATGLESAGVEFIAENGGGPGVRMRKGIQP